MLPCNELTLEDIVKSGLVERRKLLSFNEESGCGLVEEVI